MGNYSTDTDLLKIRSNILSLGVLNWESKHKDAKEYIDRSLASRWYRTIAADNNVDYRSVPFTGDQLSDGGTQVNLLSCYKTLELIYLDLMKDTPESDGFERHSSIFEKKYHKEFEEILSSGIDYDWDDSGSITSEEKDQPKKRRLQKA